MLCSHRSHYKCILKSVPLDELKQAIMDGRSISLCFKKQKVLSSGIVGGNLSIGVGIALANKIQKKPGRVFCFMGEMASTMGVFWEVYNYSINFDLDIYFIIEDNEYSVKTKTREVWNVEELWSDGRKKLPKLIYYKYDLHERYEHSGAGQIIEF